MLRCLENPPAREDALAEARAKTRTGLAEVWAGVRTLVSGKLNLGPGGIEGWSAILVNLVMLLALVSALVALFSGSRAAMRLRDQATSTANLKAALLRTELERYRAMPAVLARDPDVVGALGNASAATRHALDLKLEALSRDTKVNVVYALDRAGYAVATSNWSSSSPFCQRGVGPGGEDRIGCSGRYYFYGAMQHGKAEFFALGRANRQPGMYFSNAVDHAGERRGVVVAKVEFSELEKDWRGAPAATFVTDENGVILISNIDAWRFRALNPLTPEVRANLMTSQQFGPSQLQPLGLDRSGQNDLAKIALPGGRPETFILASVSLPTPGWKLHVLQPAERELKVATLSAGLLVFLSGLLLLVTAGILVRRRARRLIEGARQVAARAELEARVASRTAELTAANKRLRDEMDERRRIARNLNRLQDELVQANKLATLGQITAGVAHEINQPVAAIRAYAVNSARLMDRKDEAQVKRNLSLIEDLTGRISTITGELRAFSRRSAGGVADVSVTAALDGALLLVSHRIAVQGVVVRRTGERPEVLVRANQVRLEQVLVNLLQNALDSIAEAGGGSISIEVEKRRGRLSIHVSDDGGGLSKETHDGLFMPFVTTKANGLGLGLVISRDIIAEFGGQLTAKRLPRGARFTISLKVAQ